ncbi:MAG: carboxypeptidase regulatory-like domain-containing protein, partial [Saprospiraceae bacterium]|nr:carboxypeptidase regulatory-like domain-containing protein [Saprospiraceae bacterium]
MKKTYACSTPNSAAFLPHLLLWVVLALLLPLQDLSAQCSPDTEAPNAVCVGFLSVQTNTQGPNLARIKNTQIDFNSQDNCTAPQALQLRLTLDGNASTPPADTYLDLTGTGTFEVFLWVGDQAGNWSTCSAPVVVAPPSCSPDYKAPLCVAPPNAHFTEQEFAALDIDFFNMPDDLPKVRAACGSVYHWDNCSNGDSQVQESFYISEGTPTAPQQVQRRFFVTDAAGNLSEGVQYILISSPFSMHVPAYRYPNDTETDSMSYVGGFGHELYPPEDSVFAAPCPGGYSKIERTRFMIDWLYVSSTGNDAEVQLPALDLNNDGITGDAYDIIAIDDSIWLSINNVPTQKLSRRGAIYIYKQFLYNSYILRGTVHLDTLQNCAFDSGEPPLAGMQVKVIGQVSNNVYTAVTDASGAYELLVCTNDTLVEVGL